VIRLDIEAVETSLVTLTWIDLGDKVKLLRGVVIGSQGGSSHGKQWQDQVCEVHDCLCLGLRVWVQYVDD